MRGQAVVEIPVWRMIGAELPEIEARALAWIETVGIGQVVDGDSTVGGGSLPGETLPTKLWQLSHDHPERLAGRLRQAELPVIGRVSEGSLILDPRTVLPEQDPALLAALQEIKELE